MDNHTHYHYAHEECDRCGHPGPFFTSAAIGGFIGILLSTLLNSVNLFVLCTRKSLFSHNLRLCLQVLAVTDILGGVVCYVSPIIMAVDITLLTSNLTKCGIVAGVLVMLVGVSQFVLVVTAVDRCIAVSRPLTHRIFVTRKRIRFSLTLAISSSIAISAFRSFHVGIMGCCDFGKGDFLKKVPLLALYNVVPCSMVIVTTILNILIFRIAWYSQHQLDDGTSPRPEDEIRPRRVSNLHGSLIKGARTVAMVVGASCLVWTPYLVGTSIIAITKQDITTSLFCALHFIVYFTFWVNPIVFFMTNRSYKSAVKDVLGFTNNHMKATTCSPPTNPLGLVLSKI